MLWDDFLLEGAREDLGGSLGIRIVSLFVYLILSHLETNGDKHLLSSIPRVCGKFSFFGDFDTILSNKSR